MNNNESSIEHCNFLYKELFIFSKFTLFCSNVLQRNDKSTISVK